MHHAKMCTPHFYVTLIFIKEFQLPLRHAILSYIDSQIERENTPSVQKSRKLQNMKFGTNNFTTEVAFLIFIHKVRSLSAPPRRAQK